MGGLQIILVKRTTCLSLPMFYFPSRAPPNLARRNPLPHSLWFSFPPPPHPLPCIPQSALLFRFFLRGGPAISFDREGRFFSFPTLLCWLYTQAFLQGVQQACSQACSTAFLASRATTGVQLLLGIFVPRQTSPLLSQARTGDTCI